MCVVTKEIENRILNKYLHKGKNKSCINCENKREWMSLFEHVINRDDYKTVRIVIDMNVKGKKGKGRPKKR